MLIETSSDLGFFLGGCVLEDFTTSEKPDAGRGREGTTSQYWSQFLLRLNHISLLRVEREPCLWRRAMVLCWSLKHPFATGVS